MPPTTTAPRPHTHREQDGAQVWPLGGGVLEQAAVASVGQRAQRAQRLWRRLVEGSRGGVRQGAGWDWKAVAHFVGQLLGLPGSPSPPAPLACTIHTWLWCWPCASISPSLTPHAWVGTCAGAKDAHQRWSASARVRTLLQAGWGHTPPSRQIAARKHALTSGAPAPTLLQCAPHPVLTMLGCISAFDRAASSSGAAGNSVLGPPGDDSGAYRSSTFTHTSVPYHVPR